MAARKPTPAPTPNGPMEGVELVKMDALVLDDRNPRKGDVASIAQSLREFGQHRPVVAQRGTGKIVAGNHLFRAAGTLGWDKIGVVWVDDDDATAIRRGIADNATGDQATWDDDTLKNLLEEVGTDVPGVSDKVLNRLFKEVEDDAVDPVYPILAKPGEHYSFVLVYATTTLDAAWLEQALGLEKKRSYKSGTVGQARSISVTELREMLPRIQTDLAVGQ